MDFRDAQDDMEVDVDFRTVNRWMATMATSITQLTDALAAGRGGIDDGNAGTAGNAGNQGNRLGGGSLKPELETFDGSANITKAMGFMEQMKWGISVHNYTNVETQLLYVRKHLQGEAAIWFNRNAATAGWTWDTFIEDFKNRFLPPNYRSVIREDLVKTKQTTSCIAYVEKFNSLFNALPDTFWTEAGIIELFIDGLKAPIRTHIKAAESYPNTLRRAQELALARDQRWLYSQPSRGQWTNQADDGDAMDVDAMKIDNRGGGKGTAGTNRSGGRKLTCFKCGEEGHFKRDCPKGKNKADQPKNGNGQH